MKKAYDREKLKKYGFLAGAAVILILIITVIFVGTRPRTAGSAETEPASLPDQEPIVRYVTKVETKYVDKVVPVTVEKEITTAILEEGLQDMGFLVTQEYLFKEVTTFESTKTIAWIIKANSKLVMGYEGTLLAGVDFEKIKVQKNDSTKKISVTLPESSIIACDLDLESFEVYQEDVSTWNPISASDYNGSLLELENRARERAIERGILDKASDNAASLIKNFIESLVGKDTYDIVFTK